MESKLVEFGTGVTFIFAIIIFRKRVASPTVPRPGL